MVLEAKLHIVNCKNRLLNQCFEYILLWLHYI